MNKYTLVDEYITSFPKDIQKRLIEIRKLIGQTSTEAEESIAYGMPAYKLNGKPLVYFAAFKSHIGFYPTPSGIGPFKKELARYKTSKGAIQFPSSQPLPLELIEKIVKYLIANQ